MTIKRRYAWRCSNLRQRKSISHSHLVVRANCGYCESKKWQWIWSQVPNFTIQFGHESSQTNAFALVSNSWGGRATQSTLNETQLNHIVVSHCIVIHHIHSWKIFRVSWTPSNSNQWPMIFHFIGSSWGAKLMANRNAEEYIWISLLCLLHSLRFTGHWSLSYLFVAYAVFHMFNLVDTYMCFPEQTIYSINQSIKRNGFVLPMTMKSVFWYF